MQDCSEIMELLLRTQTDWQDLPEDDPQVSSLCRLTLGCYFIMKFHNFEFQNENLGLSLSSRSQHFDWSDFDSSLLQVNLNLSLVVGNKQFCELLYSRRCPPRLGVVSAHLASESSVPTSPRSRQCPPRLGVVSAHLAWSPWSQQCPPHLVALESSVPTSPGRLGVVSAHLAWSPRSRFEDSTTELISKSNI